MPLTYINARLGRMPRLLCVVMGFQMSRRRHRKAITSLILGAWLFAIFAGIANACLSETVETMHRAAMTMDVGQNGDENQPAGCEEFCNLDTPLYSKLKLVQEQPDGPPLLVAGVSVVPSPMPVSAALATPLAHPPPDVPILLRSLRLAL